MAAKHRLSQLFALAPRSGERVRERGPREPSANPSPSPKLGESRCGPVSRSPNAQDGGEAPPEPTVCPRPAQRGEGEGEGSARAISEPVALSQAGRVTVRPSKPHPAAQDGGEAPPEPTVCARPAKRAANFAHE